MEAIEEKIDNEKTKIIEFVEPAEEVIEHLKHNLKAITKLSSIFNEFDLNSNFQDINHFLNMNIKYTEKKGSYEDGLDYIDFINLSLRLLTLQRILKSLKTDIEVLEEAEDYLVLNSLVGLKNKAEAEKESILDLFSCASFDNVSKDFVSYEYFISYGLKEFLKENNIHIEEI